MNYANPTVEDIEQHEIAVEILLNSFRLVLDKPGALNRTTAAAVLGMAAHERKRQGDFGAAALLHEWSESLEQTEEVI